MAKIVAPKSPDYAPRAAAAKRRSDMKTLRAKANLSQVDKDALLQLLMDDYLARNP